MFTRGSKRNYVRVQKSKKSSKEEKEWPYKAAIHSYKDLSRSDFSSKAKSSILPQNFVDYIHAKVTT